MRETSGSMLSRESASTTFSGFGAVAGLARLSNRTGYSYNTSDFREATGGVDAGSDRETGVSFSENRLETPPVGGETSARLYHPA